MHRYLILILVAFFLSCSYDKEESKSIKTTTDNDWKNVTTITWEDLGLETEEVWSEEHAAFYLKNKFSEAQIQLNLDTIRISGILYCSKNYNVITDQISKGTACTSGEELEFFNTYKGHFIDIIDSNNLSTNDYCSKNITITGVLHLKEDTILDTYYAIDLLHIQE
ncbi:hypothetical protein [Parvicella tangerina]|uniref:Uncharacterized protein n=1 Tax=Parvicella tangerina TaxID=2829795 RepID=A0A916JLW7_9FLAO|nr:hypothetical protein [Parvicella tangerina]CAG5079963.1 hypothetical protein CRYO30217_01134 [Parvicella tangerina]